MLLGDICRDRPIYWPGQYIGRYLGFTDISVSAKTANIIGLNRSCQNAVIFLTYPDNLRKKAQWSKSRQLSYNNAIGCGFINKQTRLTMEHASAVTTKTKASTGGFAMLEATTCRCCARKLPLYFRKFSQHEKFDWYLGAAVQAMPSLAQMNLKTLTWKLNCLALSNIYGVMNMIT